MNLKKQPPNPQFKNKLLFPFTKATYISLRAQLLRHQPLPAKPEREQGLPPRTPLTSRCRVASGSALNRSTDPAKVGKVFPNPALGGTRESFGTWAPATAGSRVVWLCSPSPSRRSRFFLLLCSPAVSGDVSGVYDYRGR